VEAKRLRVKRPDNNLIITQFQKIKIARFPGLGWSEPGEMTAT